MQVQAEIEYGYAFSFGTTRTIKLTRICCLPSASRDTLLFFLLLGSFVIRREPNLLVLCEIGGESQNHLARRGFRLGSKLIQIVLTAELGESITSALHSYRKRA
jgi:hypothetical protein